MPDAQNEGLLTGLCPYGLLLGTLRGHSGTASACNVTKKILTATTQAEAKNLRTQAAAYKDNPSVWKITSHRVTEQTASRPLQPEQQRQLLVSKEEGRTVCSRICRTRQRRCPYKKVKLYHEIYEDICSTHHRSMNHMPTIISKKRQRQRRLPCNR